MKKFNYITINKIKKDLYSKFLNILNKCFDVIICDKDYILKSLSAKGFFNLK